MMRFWREEYSRHERRAPSTMMSVGVHCVLILLAVLATNPPPGLESLWQLANRVYYMPPPIRLAASPDQVPQLKYSEIAPVGAGAGFARSPIPSGQNDKSVLTFNVPGDLGADLNASAASRQHRGLDSVFTVVDVDSVVTTDPSSAAPDYPEALRKLGVEGTVQAEYVVDSTGVADPTSLHIISATRLEFALAVRNALPGMHFHPARIGPRRVRQLVVQEFAFKIQRVAADTTATVKTGKPPVH